MAPKQDSLPSHPALALLPLTPLVTAAAGLAEEEEDVVDGAATGSNIVETFGSEHLNTK